LTLPANGLAVVHREEAFRERKRLTSYHDNRHKESYDQRNISKAAPPTVYLEMTLWTCVAAPEYRLHEAAR